MKIPFIAPAYQGRSKAIAADRMVNFFAEAVKGKQGIDVIALIGCPGTLEWVTVGAALEEVRGMRVFNDLMFVVVGNKLVSVDTAGGVSATLGTLVSSTGPVRMRDNGLVSAGLGGNQLAIVDGGKTYIYNVVTGVFSILPKPANSITYIDGYFVENVAGSMSFIVSDAYNGITWPALASSPVSGDPDNIQAVETLHEQLWMVKEYTSEIWYNAAVPTSQGSPFLRLPGAVVDFGTVNGASVVLGDNSLFWLAQQKVGGSKGFIGAIEVVNYIPQPITPPSIVYQWSQYPTVADAFGMAYIDEGHTFIIWTFPSGNATWVYDTSTQLWHERSEYSAFDPYKVNRWRGNAYARFNGKHYLGGWRDGKVYEMSSAFYDDSGIPIVGERIAPRVLDDQNLHNVFMKYLQLDIEAGVGDPAADINPSASLAISYDGGNTWGSEQLAPMGRMGEYGTQLVWRRLGCGRSVTFRVRMSGKHKRVITGAYAG